MINKVIITYIGIMAMHGLTLGMCCVYVLPYKVTEILNYLYST